MKITWLQHHWAQAWGGTIYYPPSPPLRSGCCAAGAHRHTMQSHRLLQKSHMTARLIPQLPASRMVLWPVSTGPGLCTGTTSPTVHSSAQPFCRLTGSGWSSDFGDETRRLSQERKEGCTYTAQVSEWWLRILLT